MMLEPAVVCGFTGVSVKTEFGKSWSAEGYVSMG